MAKKKLPAIPEPRAPKRKSEQAAKAVAPTEPDLNHITPSLHHLVRPLAELAFMELNPLDHPDSQIAELKASLEQFGQVEPLVLNTRPNPPVVIGGNGRLKAMLLAGWTHAAVTELDLDERKANALAVALNRTADGAKWNTQHLDQILREMDTGNDPVLDQMNADLAKELKMYPDPEPDPPPPAEPEAPTAQAWDVLVECDSPEAQAATIHWLEVNGKKCRPVEVTVKSA